MPNASTRQLVQVADIQDNVVILENRSIRMVMEVTSINFELRSEEEQTAIIQNFQNFLNSVDFPLQIVISSRTYNVAEYLATVQTATAALTNELLKIQAEEYSKFIKELAELSHIMSKRFYIVVPFYTVGLESGKGFLDSFKGLFSSGKKVTVTPEQLETYKNQLLQRAELVFDGLVSLGVKARILEGQELMDIFYRLYNPEGATAGTSTPAAAQQPTA